MDVLTFDGALKALDAWSQLKRDVEEFGFTPPEQLRTMASQLKEVQVEVPNPGVYFLCKDGVVVYVGQSVNPTSRVTTHWREGTKDFDSAYAMDCPQPMLDSTEAAFIAVLRPELNLAPPRGGCVGVATVAEWFPMAAYVLLNDGSVECA